jgi:hypothetical protein
VVAQSEVVVLVLVQWAKLSAVNQLLASESLIGARMVMKQNHHLQKMELSKFQQNGIVQDVVFQQVKIKTNRLCQ